MKNILVLCTGNSCRSQMAHGFLAKMTLGKAQVYSAGVETHGVNPKAIACMKEIDIDIAHHSSNNITEYFGIDFDYVIKLLKHNICGSYSTKPHLEHLIYPKH